jgi:hypothetical protein
MDDLKLKCFKCKVLLRESEVAFSYIGQVFHAALPNCPVCGQVYLSEELVRGKVTQVERQMEDK